MADMAANTLAREKLIRDLDTVAKDQAGMLICVQLPNGTTSTLPVVRKDNADAGFPIEDHLLDPDTVEPFVSLTDGSSLIPLPFPDRSKHAMNVTGKDPLVRVCCSLRTDPANYNHSYQSDVVRRTVPLEFRKDVDNWFETEKHVIAEQCFTHDDVYDHLKQWVLQRQQTSPNFWPTYGETSENLR